MTLYASALANTLADLSEADRAALVKAVEETTRTMTSDGVIQAYTASHIVTANCQEHSI